VQIRTNLSVLTEPACEDLPAFFAQHRVRLLASLPASERAEYAVQRDPLAFDAAIEALRCLNRLGYGRDPELVLDLAVNPSDNSSDCSAEQISTAMRPRLLDRFGIVFDDVVLIANMPLGRYADYLAENSRLESQIEALRRDFNPATLPRLACRRSIEVAWDGSLSDCDFNLSAGLGLASPLSLTDLAESPDAVALLEALANRPINFGTHCLACTAGSGSS
jgi:radical SAM/Cys-rich protein